MMKKSQILAAIALAMALGVVAPITVADTASAVTEKTEKADGSATVAEANAFKASVEGSKQYKALAALEAVKAPTVTSEAAAASAIVTAYNAIVPAKDALSTEAGKEPTLNEAITFATKLDKYNAYKLAYDTFKSVDTDKTSGEGAESVITALKTAYKGITDNDYASTESYTALKAAIAGTDASPVNDYDKWSALIAATNNGVELQQAAKDLKSALTTVNSDVVQVLNLDAMDTYAKLAAAKNTVISTAQGTAYGALKTFFNGDFKTLKDATEADRKATYTALSGYVGTVATLYNQNASSLTVSKIVAGYVAPVNPAEPGDKDDVNAPATGIAGTAEGTATTVSIVAGLATALTALGAGVVAYRSARRK